MSAPAAPRVAGIEQEDRLILMDCPFCGITEHRIHSGQNQCSKTKEPFFLVSIPWTELRWKK